MAFLLLLYPRSNRRVPHISLVFREMWDTAALTLTPLAGPTNLSGCPMFAPAYVGRKRWAKPTTAFISSRYPCFIRSGQGFRVLSPLQKPGAPHLARFSRDVGYHRFTAQTCRGLNYTVGVPHVRTSVARISYYAALNATAYATFSQRKPHALAQRHQPRREIRDTWADKDGPKAHQRSVFFSPSDHVRKPPVLDQSK